MIEPRYEQERIRQALATDPRVGEPELSVDVVAGRVLVTGSVPSERVRDAIDRVVAEVAPNTPAGQPCDGPTEGRTQRGGGDHVIRLAAVGDVHCGTDMGSQIQAPSSRRCPITRTRSCWREI